MVGLYVGRFFSQTHLVTLTYSPAQKIRAPSLGKFLPVSLATENFRFS
jgi:hypothetical protein